MNRIVYSDSSDSDIIDKIQYGTSVPDAVPCQKVGEYGTIFEYTGFKAWQLLKVSRCENILTRF